jgi:hypothetical protein
LQVVDYQKKFKYVFVDMPSSMTLVSYKLLQACINGDLFELNQGEENIQPYILGDKGY